LEERTSDNPKPKKVIFCNILATSYPYFPDVTPQSMTRALWMWICTVIPMDIGVFHWWIPYYHNALFLRINVIVELFLSHIRLIKTRLFPFKFKILRRIRFLEIPEEVCHSIFWNILLTPSVS
jgi:hypothetical protein